MDSQTAKPEIPPTPLNPKPNGLKEQMLPAVPRSLQPILFKGADWFELGGLGFGA